MILAPEEDYAIKTTVSLSLETCHRFMVFYSIKPEVMNICEAVIDSVGCGDSTELSIIQICHAVPEMRPCTNTHSSAAVPPTDEVS